MEKLFYLKPMTEIVFLSSEEIMQVNLLQASKGGKINIAFDKVQAIPEDDAAYAVTNISNLWDDEELENE